jgi:signal transduction histidine kinase
MEPGERLRELIVGGGFLVLAVLLALLAEPERSWDVTRAAVLVAAFAIAARIELDVGAGYTVPTQLVFVPMLFLLPTPWVPLLVAGGWFLAKLPDALDGRIPFERVMLGIGNSWFALGPALVLVAFDAQVPDWDLWHVYVFALVAQFAGDLVAAAIREGPRASMALELMSGVYLIDVLLSGPALLAAFASRDAPYAFLAILPAVLLFVLFGRERSERLHDALALAERSEQAAELAGRLLETEREATRVREDVLAGASAAVLHPISRLTSLIYRVRRGDDQEVALSEMEREVQHLRHNAGQFIDYSLIKAGRGLEVTPRTTDVARLIRGAATAWAPADGVRVELPDELPTVYADDGRVLQMLMILISNAVKFSEPRAPVRVTASAGAEAVSITVADEGPGIPERDLERIFEELRRGSTAHGTQGSGLGLYLCRVIAEASGGELLVRSREGEGSTFTLVLPRAEASSRPGS